MRSAEGLADFFALAETDSGFRDAPHVRLEALQAKGPAHAFLGGATALITQHALVRQVLENGDLGKSSDLAAQTPIKRAIFEMYRPVRERYGKSREMSYMDDPDHGRVRAVISEAFSRHFANLKPQVSAIVAEALANVAGRSHFDVIGDYARNIPVAVVGALLGLRPERLDRVGHAANQLIAGLSPSEELTVSQQRIAGILALQEVIAELLEDHRREPRSDMTGALLELQAGGAQISDAEIRDGLLTFLYAGHVSTTMLIGNGVWLLLTHPDQRALLEADPSLIAGAVEEILRFEPPVTRAKRYAGDKFSIEGCPHIAGAGMVASLQAANRDPDVFVEPHKFDILRRRSGHVSFGGGAHLCLGAPLARLEAQIAIQQLLIAHPELRLADGFRCEWAATPGFRSLRQLPVCGARSTE